MPTEQEAQRLAAFAILTFLAFASVVFWLLTRKPQRFLNKQRKWVQISDIVEVTHDTKRFRLDLGRNTILGLNVGKHLMVIAPAPKKCLETGLWNEKSDNDHGAVEIQRPYTPITGDWTVGYADIVVKIYRPGKVKMSDGAVHEWVDGGKMGIYLDAKKPGDWIEVRGPVGIKEYLGRGEWKLPGQPSVRASHVGMLAGGAGITPILQILNASLRDPKDLTRFTLLYANKCDADVQFRDALAEMVERGLGRIQVHLTLDFPPTGWENKKSAIPQHSGLISETMITEIFPPPSDEVLFVICGPPPMVEYAAKRPLEKLGYQRLAVF